MEVSFYLSWRCARVVSVGVESKGIGVATEADKELGLIVLGLALASREMLDAAKGSLKASDFGAKWMGLAAAILEENKELLSKEVKSLLGVTSGTGKLGLSIIRLMSGRATKKRLATLTGKLSLRTMHLDEEKAQEIEKELHSVLKKLGAIE